VSVQGLEVIEFVGEEEGAFIEGHLQHLGGALQLHEVQRPVLPDLLPGDGGCPQLGAFGPGRPLQLGSGA